MRWSRARGRIGASTARSFDSVLRMTADGFATRRGRRAALVHRDEVNATVRGRRGARLLAQTSGGAIPEVADYRVVLDPDDTFIGTLNEDFAIESTAGDVFQLGNASWRVLQVAGGNVRVADAKGAPPTIPFWLGEAPARSDELSRAVSDLRAEVDRRLDDRETPQRRHASTGWWRRQGSTTDAAEQAVVVPRGGRRALGVIPTQETLVLERFFDESGGMQLVLHAPFGSRINKAWGLALRKRFCRQFNFELQAAATEDALMLSLGPAALVSAVRRLPLSAPRDDARRARAGVSRRAGVQDAVAMEHDDLAGGAARARRAQGGAAAPADAGRRPDGGGVSRRGGLPREHSRAIGRFPIIRSSLRPCATASRRRWTSTGCAPCSAASIAASCASSRATRRSRRSSRTRSSTPSRTRFSTMRRSRSGGATRCSPGARPTPTSAGDLGALDADAIARVREEERPDPRDADELHDALLTAGFLTARRAGSDAAVTLARRAGARPRRAGSVDVGTSGATRAARIVVAAERLPELRAVHPDLMRHAARSQPPASRLRAVWTRDDAIVELLRGRADDRRSGRPRRRCADPLGISRADADAALLALEARRRRAARPLHARRDRARMVRPRAARAHSSLHAEPAARRDRAGQPGRLHAVPVRAGSTSSRRTRLTGLDGLREVVAALDGFELAGGRVGARGAAGAARSLRAVDARHALPDGRGRLGASLAGRTSRRSPVPQLVPATPIALFLREHADAWRALRTQRERGAAARRATARAC